jgi:hypothetical protein
MRGFTKLSVELSGLSTEVGVMEINLEFAAAELVSESKKRYDQWRKTSYFLYALGWGVTLLGKMAGVGNLGVGE